MMSLKESSIKSIESFGNIKSIILTIEDKEYTSENLTPDISFESSISNNDYTLGNTICSSLRFNLINTNNKYNERFFKDKKVKCVAKIENTEEGAYDLIQIGVFNCVRPLIKSGGIISIDAFDNIVKFEINSDSFLNSVNYPINVVEFIRKMCDYVKVEYELNEANIQNKDFVIRSRPESKKLTLRELLGQAALICASNVVINGESNKLELRYLNETSYEIPESVHISGELQDFKVELIGNVTINNKDNNDVYYGDKSKAPYYIDNMELIYGNTDDELVSCAFYIYKELTRISYNPIQLNLGRGLIFLNCGDIVTVKFKGNVVKFPILKREASGIFLSDKLHATGSEVRDRRDKAINGAQASNIAKNASKYGIYDLIGIHRYLSLSGDSIVAMGMVHEGLPKELIFKPNYLGNTLIGIDTNFSDSIPNEETYGIDPDMTRLDEKEKEEEKP